LDVINASSTYKPINNSYHLVIVEFALVDIWHYLLSNKSTQIFGLLECKFRKYFEMGIIFLINVLFGFGVWMCYVLWAMYYGLCVMGYVLWAMCYGLCVMGYVLWAMYYGLCVMGYVLWAMYYGLCVMGYVLWAMYGLCIMGYVLCAMYYVGLGFGCAMYYGLCVMWVWVLDVLCIMVYVLCGFGLAWVIGQDFRINKIF
jgi:hypothetical protein